MEWTRHVFSIGPLPLLVASAGLLCLILSVAYPIGHSANLGGTGGGTPLDAEAVRWRLTQTHPVELTTHPVFHQDRTFHAKAVPIIAETPAPTPLRQLKVSGIFSGTGADFIAAVLDETNNMQLILREGDEIDGYKISKIDGKTITLTNGDAELILKLRPDQP